MNEKYEIISSCINSVIMVTLLSRRTLMKYSYGNNESTTWNYWQAEATLSMELNAHVPQLTEAENSFRSFESKLQNFQLDEKEFSLLLLMIITRTSKREYFFNQKSNFFELDLNVMNEQNKFWTKCQFECVQAFSEYTQGTNFVDNFSLIKFIL